MVDCSTKVGQQGIKRHYAEEGIGLTTITPRGEPQPNLVWFSGMEEKFAFTTNLGHTEYGIYNAIPWSA